MKHKLEEVSPEEGSGDARRSFHALRALPTAGDAPTPQSRLLEEQSPEGGGHEICSHLHLWQALESGNHAFTERRYLEERSLPVKVC